MKLRRYVIALAILVAIVWWRNSYDDETIDRAIDRITLPYRVAKMYTRPADATIRMPVHGAAKAQVANTWHAPRPGGRKHEGQDIFARKGTPVVSATEGIVVRIGDGKLGGNAVFVLGPGGRTYYYAHLDRYAAGLTVGKQVATGEVLGYVGNTGNARSTPPHLHFSIYTASGVVNPLPLITDGAEESRAGD